MTGLKRLCLALVEAAALSLAALSLAGCASEPENVGDPNYNSEAAAEIDAQNLKVSQHNRCILLKTDPGTDAYDHCMESLAISDAQAGTAGDRARSQSRRLNAASSQPVSCKTSIVRAMPKTECF
jgi:hypothetical protein